MFLGPRTAALFTKNAQFATKFLPYAARYLSDKAAQATIGVVDCVITTPSGLQVTHTFTVENTGTTPADEYIFIRDVQDALKQIPGITGSALVKGAEVIGVAGASAFPNDGEISG